MKILNEHELQDVMSACFRGRFIQVGVAFSNHERLHDFATAMRNEIDGKGAPCMFYARGTKNFKDIDTIWFDGGSNIRLFDVSDPWEMRGRRYDVVLYDEEISDELLAALKYCERSNSAYYIKQAYQYIPVDKAEDVDSKELDDFLNEFIK